MKKNFFIITAVVCGMSCTTTAYAPVSYTHLTLPTNSRV